jgi:putative restriction endonuclease
MKTYVGITDFDWFNLLKSLPEQEEVNFWQPSGKRLFRALNPGELFLFKLHSPHDFIVGGGIFAHSSILPMSLAWESFGISNGASNLSEMRMRITKYRHQNEERTIDHNIGCIILEQPFFLPENAWVPIPADWKSNTRS